MPTADPPVDMFLDMEQWLRRYNVRAAVGDRIIISSNRLDQPAADGEIAAAHVLQRLAEHLLARASNDRTALATAQTPPPGR
jgi:hypothetical protein